MKFDIPEHCHIRWQAALAVLEDLQEDKKAPFSMGRWASRRTIWEKTNGCGNAACFGGYISVAPYCQSLGYPKKDFGKRAGAWLLDDNSDGGLWHPLFDHIFSPDLNAGSRAKTLKFLKRRVKETFKESTGKDLVAPMTFYI